MSEENLEENLANMDLGNLEKLANLADGEDLAAARKKLLDMIKNDELSEEVKEGLKAMLSGNAPAFGGAGAFLAVGLAVFIFSILLFFGYKLYKSIKDKEMKKEEKKKLKQQKKKK